MRYPLGLGTRAFVGAFFLGAAALLWFGPQAGGSQRDVALATALIGVLPLVLPSYARSDSHGISLVLLGMRGGRVEWRDIRSVVTTRSPLRRVHVTSVFARGRPRLVIPAELRGYRLLLSDIARHRPDALDEPSAAIVHGEERIASLERYAPALVALELLAFGYLGLRLVS